MFMNLYQKSIYHINKIHHRSHFVRFIKNERFHKRLADKS